MDSATPLIDPFARPITYLRVSVTDRCDFRCTYCMSEHMQFLPKRDLLTLEELDRLCSAFVGMGLRKLRVTGGEPLVRRDILTFASKGWPDKLIGEELGITESTVRNHWHHIFRRLGVNNRTEAVTQALRRKII